MGLFNWLMKGIGFEEDQETEAQNQAIADEKRKYKELKKQQKLAKKLAKQQAKNARYRVEEPSSPPSETVFAEPEPQSTFDPDQYNISAQGNYNQGGGYDNNGYGQTSMAGYGNKNVIFFYPKSYSEVQKLIDYLRNGETVMLNLDGISDNEAQRMLDFASGAVYALSGSIQRVSGNIFLLTPEGLGIITSKR